MDQLEEAKRAWQADQAALRDASAHLERLIDQGASAGSVEEARAEMERRRRAADHTLTRYISQLARS